MSWTDERVERLSTLWLEGRSASQIAAELGGGVSRNAVIGKVHRLGLSGRAVPPAVMPPAADAPLLGPEAQPAAVPPAAPVEAVLAAEAIPAEAAPETSAVAPAMPEMSDGPAMPEAPAVAVHTMDDVASILDAAAEPITVDVPALRAAHGTSKPASNAAARGIGNGAALEVVIPISGRVTILELSGSMCRWPIGDPTSAEFRFCGCRAVGTYCQDHARVAFQPVADRRRTERLIRIA